MKCIIITLLLLTIVDLTFAQRSGGPFLDGKVIENNGDTINVQISYNNWSLTPESISYRLNSSTDLITSTATGIRGFKINEVGSFISAKVQIDISSDILRQLSSNPDPEWVSKDIFLQELVVSKVNLYRYSSKSFKRFFYSKKSSSQPKQLIYKKYKPKTNIVASNNTFRKQLWDNLRCGSLTQQKLKKIDFYESDLIKFFERHNECSGIKIEKIVKKAVGGEFRFNLRAGISSVNGRFTKVDGVVIGVNATIGVDATSSFSTRGQRLDTEIEYLSPLQNKTISFFANVGFEQHSSSGIWEQQLLFSQTNVTTRVDQTWSVDYSNLSVGIGVRKYIKLKGQLQLLLDYLIQPSIDIIANYEYEIITPVDPGTPEAPGFSVPKFDLRKNSSVYHGVGVGLKYRYVNLGVRYFTDRIFLRDMNSAITTNAKFSALIFQLGFSFSSKK